MLIQCGLEKLEELNMLESGTVVFQKRYFLIISADNLEKANRGFGNIRNELLSAGLNLKECDFKGVEICLTKLIPTYGNKNNIVFGSKGYEVINPETKEKKFYRTVLVTKLPNAIGTF
jgi:hypothetical protein